MDIQEWAKREVASAETAKAPKGISEEAITLKMQAGLSRGQAIAVLEQQAEHDAGLDEKPAKAPKAPKAPKAEKPAAAPKAAAKTEKPAAAKAVAKKISGDGKEASPGNAETAKAD